MIQQFGAKAFTLNPQQVNIISCPVPVTVLGLRRSNSGKIQLIDPGVTCY